MNSRATAAFNRRNSVVKAIAVRPKLLSPSVSVSSIPDDSVDSDCCNAEMLVQNYSNFQRSGPPARLMYYDDNGSWSDFTVDVADSVRLGFQEGKAVVEVRFGKAVHLFDLYRMLQVDLDTGDQRSLAWIDAHGKCFFPKTFVGSSGKFPNSAKETVEIAKVSVDSKKRRIGSEVIEPEESRCGAKKSRTSDDDVEFQTPAWPKTKLLREGEKAHAIVKSLFLSGLGFTESSGARITSIHQWMRSGCLDRARYEVFQKQLEITKVARGDSKMTFAWYGTSARGVASVLSHGFSVPSKVPGPEAHGVGIYLSPIRSPHLSAMLSEVDDNGEKHVILCRVILGKCEKVEAGSRQMYPSGVDFDSGVDDLMNPKWYVVWRANMNTHILPECVVSYRSSDFVPGQIGGPSFVKSAKDSSTPLFAKLQLKIGTSLPSSRVQEFRSLCTAYKDGKVAKHAFMKQLRSVVGDDMLASVIREVRG
ncbi:probable inactive poly [ADP-ribose] polymerase SRO2 [Rhododendron vialii]|uniref:probable inactive poly [ADP-ribose] polymerase SRO2 n=1 Tax=Rhododendron vialii TaxID=182163 RepID=UPI00266043E3|nr:probable inactive poly [ADP-ribose] polymerase SRO2 [Rhododendron vialii]